MVAVAREPMTKGLTGSVTSTKLVPFLIPMSANSLPESESVHPHISFMFCTPPNSESDIVDIKSTLSHG